MSVDKGIRDHTGKCRFPPLSVLCFVFIQIMKEVAKAYNGEQCVEVTRHI